MRFSRLRGKAARTGAMRRFPWLDRSSAACWPVCFCGCSQFPEVSEIFGQTGVEKRMGLMRSLLLAASQNRWLRDHATQYSFVRGTVSRFMPGETLDDALGAADTLRSKKIGTVFTHLGENIKDRVEAQQVAEHYLEVLKRIREKGLRAEISVKLTQLGMDLSADLCFEHLNAIIECAEKDSIVWVDMEASNYVDATLDLYRRVLSVRPNVGICLQAYLRSEEHTSELQSPCNLVCRLLLEKTNPTERVTILIRV